MSSFAVSGVSEFAVLYQLGSVWAVASVESLRAGVPDTRLVSLSRSVRAGGSSVVSVLASESVVSVPAPVSTVSGVSVGKSRSVEGVFLGLLSAGFVPVVSASVVSGVVVSASVERYLPVAVDVLPVVCASVSECLGVEVAVRSVSAVSSVGCSLYGGLDSEVYVFEDSTVLGGGDFVDGSDVLVRFTGGKSPSISLMYLVDSGF